MAKRTASKIKAASKPRITAAAQMGEPSPSINNGGGIRSGPQAVLWRNWRMETPAIARDRVVKSRALQEMLPFIGYLVSQLPEEALGDGLTPASESANPKFKKAAVKYFDTWARSPAIDIRNRFDFYTSQHMLGQTMIGDGEVFALKVADRTPTARARPLTDKSFRALRLQFLTRDQLGNAGQRDLVSNGTDLIWDAGIQFDANDVAQKIRVLKQSSSITLLATGFYEYDYDQVMHIFSERNLNQRHGTPWLFRADNSLFDALDLQAVKKFAAKIRAYFLGVITTPSGDTPNAMRPNVKKGTTAESDGTRKDDGMRYIELGGGISIPVLKTGESINFFNGTEPISFADILQACWNEAVYTLGFPPEYLLNISGLGSGSVRMVLRKVKKALDRIRRPVREQYCQKVWEYVIGDAIEQGLDWTKDENGKVVEDWRMVNWVGGIDPSIDAGRDEQAEQNKLRSFTGTREDYCSAIGKDGETVGRARLAEIAGDIDYMVNVLKKPWYLAVDPAVLQSLAAIAASPIAQINPEEVAAAVVAQK